jgi:hypothetical protein
VKTGDLRDAEEPAQQAVTALVIDAPLEPQDKIAVATALGEALSAERGQVPDLAPAFASLDVARADRPALARLERDLDDQLERAASASPAPIRNESRKARLAALLTLVRPRRREAVR